MSELPIPPHFDPARVGEVWPVPYEARAAGAEAWAREHGVGPAADDDFRIALLAVDCQNTFCVPGFELFVAGRSGRGAVEDTARLCEFLYRNLGGITQVVPTLDTHQALQVFHAVWLVDVDGRHPAPYTLVTAQEVDAGAWQVDPAVAADLGLDQESAAALLRHYTRRLAEGGKYELTIWPYHSMLGGIGHALVASLEEAIFFHSIARRSQPDFEIKGRSPFTEHYSALGPEVTQGPAGELLAERNDRLVERLLGFDAIVIAGQAKSHCVAWTVADLLGDTRARAESLPERIYLLEDCTSPVVVPGVIDYSDRADAEFRRFGARGAHLVRSTDPIAFWPGIE